LKNNLTLPLDLNSIPKETNWRQNFYWPINSISLIKVREDLERILFQVLDETESHDNKSILRIVFNFLIKEHICLYNALYVTQEATKAKFDLRVENQLLWNGLSKQIVNFGIPKKPIFTPAENIFYESRSWLNYLRSLKLSLISKKSKNLVLSCGGILEDRLKNDLENSSVILFHTIFRSLENISIIDQKFINKISKLIYDYYESSKIDTSNALYNYIKKYHSALFRKTLQYLITADKYLLDSKYRKIFFTSGQNYFHRVVAESGRRNGIESVGHEHGEPKALKNSTINYYGELGLVSEFVTYTEECKNNYINFSINKRLLHKMPKLRVSNNHSGNKIIDKTKLSNIRKRSDTIMYVSGAYNNDAIFFAMRPHDIVYFEFQLWIWELLIDSGYDLKVKLHPEAISRYIDIDLPKGIKTIDGYFQDHLDENVIFLFDGSHSSALEYAIASNNPIIFIDNTVDQLDTSVKLDLSFRASVIDGFYDKKNRLRINPQDLTDAVSSCDHNKNHDFFQKYYDSSLSPLYNNKNS
tara:strand:+ start:373 stop:1956 length:1584 start_codon:yes stop_codon:yes gene_type:complete